MTANADTPIVVRERRRPGPIFLVVILAAFGALIALGTWQVERLQWKEALLATIEQRIVAEPMALPEAEALFAAEQDVEYVPIRLSGTFDHASEQHFLATHQGQSGWYVYTPLTLEDGRSIIVNRGFVPYDMKNIADRPWQEPTGIVGFDALARNPLFEKPGFVVPDNAPADNLWYWKDFEAMREAMGLQTESLVPFFADIRTYDAPVNSYPIPGVTQVALPNNHLQYAVTWYGLAAALAGVVGFMFLRRPQDSDREA
ncbi:SURF1 family protein [Georhizobium profundi]|nr:SURF1 family protein [Georhizobium profundi]